MHGDNDESIKIIVRWHDEDNDEEIDGATVNPSKNLPAKVSHFLLIRTYYTQKGYVPEFCYFTFIPRALADKQQVVSYVELKKDFSYELIPQKRFETYPYSNQRLQQDTIIEMEDTAKEVESVIRYCKGTAYQ
ncbi:hypothetical protein HP548_22845 [Paenibacillus taichungensis]|uniref:BAH domain-containing protein n=1 Tax=Paenibacillus taichungensis TaxID=484184 RepID=A0ABX2MS60_9BACL|nr:MULTISPECIES: hypothetical protein [Paenibacillus]NUU56924.1 hypothetical protein [Paenibacillus taichungensis]PIH60246.1 hypothetical protein CS562_03830 [Paenibacillus sp. LK1]